jgi:geranylgeranyl diphosphate synthase type II
MARTNTEILELFESALAQLSVPEEPKLLYTPIIYSMSGGGKRLRPVLLLITAEAFGGSIEESMPAALAVEIFHNFTLLHDDIMDNSSMRRGQPTVHCRWNDNTAILSGDAMLILSYEILARSNPELIVKLLPIFTRVALEVCEGQQLDMDFESCEEVSLENYIEMIRLKTGVLLAGAVQLGALCGGASDKDAELMYEFGVNLGLLFQITDDILDTYGDPKVFGKSIGGDILCRKKTFLLVSALQNATEQQRDRLCKLLEDESLAAAEKIAAVTAIYDEFNIRQVAEQASDKYFRLAMEALEQVSLDKNRKSELAEYATKIRYREK